MLEETTNTPEMQKVIIELPKYMVDDISDRHKHPNKGNGISSLEEAVATGTILTHNTLHGDAFRKIFDCTAIMYGDTVTVPGIGKLSLEWWNERCN